MSFALNRVSSTIAHPEHDFRRQSEHGLFGVTHTQASATCTAFTGLGLGLHTACLCVGVLMQVSLWTTTKRSYPCGRAAFPGSPSQCPAAASCKSRDAAASPPGKPTATSSRSPFEHALHASHLLQPRQPADIPKILGSAAHVNANVQYVQSSTMWSGIANQLIADTSLHIL